MAKQTVSVKRRVKKDEVPSGTHVCPSCGGKGWKSNVGRKPGSKK